MKKIKIFALISLIIMTLSLCSCSESCARSCKDFNSNYNGGLHRTVRVYDFEGDLVAEYEGKFDIETDNETYVLWDDEMGKRHIIYYSTFNIIIDEN
jgi:hypothetical protein